MAQQQTADIRYWKDQIHRGIEYQRKYGHSDDWQKWEQFYVGDWTTLGQKLPINYMFSQFKSLIPQIYFRNPRVTVTGRRYGMDAGARVLEVLLNWLVQEMALKRNMKRAALDALVCGTGIVKLGYDSEHGFDPKRLLGPMMTPMGVADASGETDAQFDEEFKKLEYSLDVQPGMPWALRVHPKDFLIDPSATCIEDARWCAHRTLRTIDDVMKSPLYEKGDKRGLEPTRSEEYNDHDEPRMITPESWQSKAEDPENTRPKSITDEWVELWEIHEAKARRVITLNLTHKKMLRDDFDELQFDGLPFRALIFNQHPKTFWGISDAQVLHPQQEELNTTRRLQQQYRKMALRRLLVKKGLIPDGEKHKFTSDKPFEFIETDGEVGKLADDIKELDGFMPNDLASWSELIEADMRDLLGQGRNQMGEFNRGAEGGQSRASATEANIVQQNSQIRVDERRDVMADMFASIMRACAQMVFKWWDKPRVARVAGPEGMQYWVNYSGPELEGEYDYLVQPDDALPMTKEQRKQDAIALFQVMAQFLLPQQMQELQRHVMRQFEGVDADAVLNPPQMPGVMGLGAFGDVLQGAGQQQMMGGGSANVPVPMPDMQGAM